MYLHHGGVRVEQAKALLIVDNADVFAIRPKMTYRRGVGCGARVSGLFYSGGKSGAVDATSVDATLLLLPMVKNAGSRTLQGATATVEPDPFPSFGLIQAFRMTSLVSDNLMGASLSFPTPPPEKVLMHRSRRDATGSLNLLDDDSRKPTQRSRTMERMRSDSH